MKTPIKDFVEEYVDRSPVRFHMPGHKGAPFIGCEKWDITEISGMNSLYANDGIICKSEENASLLFGCPTFYSTEGSSQCIKAMSFLVCKYAKSIGRKPIIASFRNAHSSFISASVLVDFDIQWIYSSGNNYLSCEVDYQNLDGILSQMEEKPIALLVTSPDYMGQIYDISSIAKVCHKHQILLLVDNAHGAYLKFLKNSQFPIDLGADLVCDSAHKTMPVLTGGAYLHLSPSLPKFFTDEVKSSMALFGSTSPSFLILQSLDQNNLYLYTTYKDKLSCVISKIKETKEMLCKMGYDVEDSEPLKIVVNTAKYGYIGSDFADILTKEKIYCEFYDRNFIIFMISPENSLSDFDLFINAMSKISSKDSIYTIPPSLSSYQTLAKIKDVAFSSLEILPIEKCENKIFADWNIACPPAVCPIVCGERITKEIIHLLSYYGIEKCKVVKE